MRLFRVVALGLALWLCSSVAQAANSVGLVLLHERAGMPGDLSSLVKDLQAAGYMVAAPEMCWSQKRIYDKIFNDCLSEIDNIIVQMKEKGIRRVVVGGDSEGAVAAIAYAATHSSVAGVIALEPSADPVNTDQYPPLSAAIKSAENMIAAGQGETEATFVAPVFGGRYVKAHATPIAYLSFHSPDTPVANMAIVRSAALPRLFMPVLWVSGTQDDPENKSAVAFAAIPENTRNKYAPIDANHDDLILLSSTVVLDWLQIIH